jgi:hypothetical protein
MWRLEISATLWYIYKALLGNNPVKQQWKRSDRCYAMTHYTRIHNGGEDDFCVVGAVVISRVWSQLQTPQPVQYDPAEWREKSE